MDLKTILVPLFFACIHVGHGAEPVIGANGIEIKVIPDTNLFTGVHYRIDFPDISFGILTWAETKTKDGTGWYLQLDDHVERVQDYAAGGKWFRDGLWNLRGSEVSGYYTIENANLPSRTLGVTVPLESPQSQPLYPTATYLVMMSNTTYSRSTIESVNRSEPKHKNRDLTLWKVIPGKAQNQYMLVNKAVPGLVVETPRYGDFHKFVTIATYGNSCKGSESFLKFTAVSVV